MRILNINHVNITAPMGSEPRLRQFYGELLGLREIPKPAQLQSRFGVWFDAGNMQLHISIEDAPNNEKSRRHIAFQVESLGMVRAALTGAGYAIEEDEKPLDGVKRFYTRDVVGNRLEFLEVLSADHPFAVSDKPRLMAPKLFAEFDIREGRFERVALSPDGVWVAAGTSNEESKRLGDNLYVWRMDKPQEPEVEIELSAPVMELTFSPDGKELLCLTEDGSLESWRVGDFESANFAELVESSSGLAFTADGQLLLVGTENEIAMFRPGFELWYSIKPSVGAINSLSIGADDMVAICGDDQDFIQLWQLRPMQRSAWELRGHEGALLQLAFNPAGPALAAVAQNGQVYVWDLNDNPEEPFAPEELSDVNAVAFSPDGLLLASADAAGQITLWNWREKKVVHATEPSGAELMWVTFSADARYMASAGVDGRVHIWQVAA